MYIYDRANALAQDIKDSEEYKAFKVLKDEVYADEATKGLIKQYKAAQFEAQTQVMSGKEPGADVMDKLKKLGEVLGLNARVGEYFAAEYKFNTLVSDIYRIIGDACDIDADFLQGQ